MGLFEQAPWLYAIPVVLAALVAAIVWLWIDRVRNRRAAFTQWNAYLNNIETSLRNLSSLELALKPYFEGKDPKMSEPGFQLHQVVKTEVNALHGQLDGVASFHDYLYSDAPIDWRPFPPLADHLATLVALAGHRVQKSKKNKNVVQENMDGLQNSLVHLETADHDIGDRMKALAEQISELSEAWPGNAEEDRHAFRRARSVLSEEGIAARLMAELQSNRSLTEISDQLEKTEAEIQVQRNLLSDPDLSPERHHQVEGRLDWLMQVKRWWRLQQRLCNQDNLLKACQGQMEEITDADYRERFEAWMNSLAAQDEIDRLHDRIGDLSLERRLALRYAEIIQKEQPAIQRIGKLLYQVEGLRESSHGDITLMKKTLSEIDEAFQGMSLNRDQLRYYEEALEKTRKAEREAKGELENIRRQLDESRQQLGIERKKFEQTLRIMQNALEKETASKQELEDGLSKLQASYEMLKQRITK